MTSIALTFRSTAPLIMHSARLTDPLDPIAIALARYHEKAKLGPSDHMAIADLEFTGGLWTTDDGRPCVPARTVEAALHEAARRRAIEQRIVKTVAVSEDCPLDHPGPRTTAALLRDPEFRHRSPVTIDGKRQMRTRPIFRTWSLTAVIHYDASRIGRDVVVDCAIAAGDGIGIGAGRPRNGRFSVTPALVTTA